MIALAQDADGTVRENRHYPASVRIFIAFADGSTGEFSSRVLNNAYDTAVRNSGPRMISTPAVTQGPALAGQTPAPCDLLGRNPVGLGNVSSPAQFA